MALTDQLTSFWELGEASGTRVDSVVGTANDLTDNNTVTQNTGIVGNAAEFDGANSEYLSRADNAGLSPTGNFTVTGWYYGTALSGSNRAMISKESVNNSYYLYYATSLTAFRWRVSDNGVGVYAVNSTVTPSTTTWYFVVVYYDGTNIGISVNDTLTTTAYSSGIYDSTDSFKIGGKPLFDSEYWTGRIDQVGFWSRAISSGEITQLYNSGAGLSYAAMQSVAAGGRYTGQGQLVSSKRGQLAVHP